MRLHLAAMTALLLGCLLAGTSSADNPLLQEIERFERLRDAGFGIVYEPGAVFVHAMQSSVRKLDAALRRAERTGLTRAERREVVGQHPGPIFLAVRHLEALGVGVGAEGDGDERLGLAAGEDRGAVGARGDAGLAPDRADRVGQGIRGPGTTPVRSKTSAKRRLASPKSAP